jgi:hypothetical protein
LDAWIRLRAVIEIDLNELRGCFGFGVAGNFAGHLEQAGEAADFIHVGEPGIEAPKGIFPFYAPGGATFLGEFPLSNDRIAKPPSDAPVDLQIEPEMGLICDVAYSTDGAVEELRPFAAGAFNDCSIRRPEIKISIKKNWGPDSKGVARAFFPVPVLEAGAATALRIASFLRRDGKTHAYGLDTAVTTYSYYGAQLLDWLVDRLGNQIGAGDSPLEPVGEYLRASGNPARVLIGVGATRYTALGESTYLSAGDESIVVLYDGDSYDQGEVAAAIAENRDAELPQASILRQHVYDAV